MTPEKTASSHNRSTKKHEATQPAKGKEDTTKTEKATYEATSLKTRQLKTARQQATNEATKREAAILGWQTPPPEQQGMLL